jgi:hypothetical protein
MISLVQTKYVVVVAVLVLLVCLVITMVIWFPFGVLEVLVDLQTLQVQM